MVTHLIHDYQANIPWISMLLRGFRDTRQVQELKAYDVLLYIYVIVVCMCVVASCHYRPHYCRCGAEFPPFPCPNLIVLDVYVKEGSAAALP